MTKTILSVDLAVASYKNCGFALLRSLTRETSGMREYNSFYHCQHAKLTDKRKRWQLSLLSAKQMDLVQIPNPAKMAEKLAIFCSRESVNVLLIDGPQGWKRSDSALPFRKADIEAKAPAKVASKGIVKPRTYITFVEFSTQLFMTLTKRYGDLFRLLGSGEGKATFKELIEEEEANTLLCESLPFACWRMLGLKPLPSKTACSKAEILKRYQKLLMKFGIRGAGRLPNHDELQALVASTALIPTLEGASNAITLLGEKPILGKECIFEGYIVCPR